MRGLVILVLLVVGIGYLFSLGSGRSTTTASAVAAAPVATIDKSEAMQADRLAFLQRMINERVFTKFEQPGTLTRAFVGPAFYAATIDQKQSFVSVVYAYSYDGSNATDSVRLFDGQTGKEIGRYPNASGRLELF
ncbi:hypothetical protein [Devosia sp. SL43]|uniref:hypothetical protein n=1 Tax=Devosia sp. SL43 TaxID=2806348 RepID=UPI001F3F5D81|nr:hypothetical protein [Devosia sp. SL43]UJW87922.1 hypothetical protein IM737_20790 [Devosia sp. SL43]